jgi:hypothetical protein
MSGVRDIILVARRLSEDLGPEGPAIVAKRAERLRDGGELEDAGFWRHVACAMRSLTASAPQAKIH